MSETLSRIEARLSAIEWRLAAIHQALTEQPPEERLIGILEVARLLQCSERTVRILVKNGRFIPGIKLSTQMVRWRFRDVAKWMDGQG